MRAKPARPNIPTRPAIEIELLALDLTACTRCTGTLANIETAIKLLRPALATTGRELRFRKVVIASEDQARWHRFTLSPTIRVNGRDLVFETFETPCESCADLCGCPEGTTCRQWRYLGRDHTEAPVGLIVEALLAAMADVGGEVGVAREGADPGSARPLTPTLSPAKPGEREKKPRRDCGRPALSSPLPPRRVDGASPREGDSPLSLSPLRPSPRQSRVRGNRPAATEECCRANEQEECCGVDEREECCAADEKVSCCRQSPVLRLSVIPCPRFTTPP